MWDLIRYFDEYRQRFGSLQPLTRIYAFMVAIVLVISVSVLTHGWVYPSLAAVLSVAACVVVLAAPIERAIMKAVSKMRTPPE